MLRVVNYPDWSIFRASRQSKVCIAITRVAVKEKIPEMLPQNEKKISKIRLPNREANLRKRKKTIGLSAIQHAFVNGSEILQIYLAWKFLRYNYSGYTHDDSKREEKSIEVKTKQQQSPSLQTFVYACSQYLGAIPLIVVEFSSFFRSFWGWFGGVKCVMQPCVGDCRPVLTCGREKINPKSDFSMQGACMYQKREKCMCVKTIKLWYKSEWAQGEKGTFVWPSENKFKRWPKSIPPLDHLDWCEIFTPLCRFIPDMCAITVNPDGNFSASMQLKIKYYFSSVGQWNVQSK